MLSPLTDTWNNICSLLYGCVRVWGCCMCVCANTQHNINKYCQRNIQLVIPSACLLCFHRCLCERICLISIWTPWRPPFCLSLFPSLSFTLAKAIPNAISLTYLQKFIEIVCQIPFTCFAHFGQIFFCLRRRRRQTSTSADVLYATLSLFFLLILAWQLI